MELVLVVALLSAAPLAVVGYAVRQEHGRKGLWLYAVGLLLGMGWTVSVTIRIYASFYA